MIVEEREGKLCEEDGFEAGLEAAATPVHSLFGRAAITEQEAVMEGIDLFAARVAAFDMAMQSSFEHFKLKQDLVEHIFNSFKD